MFRLTNALWYFFLLLIISSSACKNDDDDSPFIEGELTSVEEIKTFLSEAQNDHILIRKINRDAEKGYYDIIMENDIVRVVRESLIREVNENQEEWEVRFVLEDGAECIAGLLGDQILISDNDIKLNPFGTAPLSALVTINTKVPGKMAIRVAGQDGNDSDVGHSFDYFGEEHSLPIFGLYPDYSNTVEIIFTDEEGRERVRQPIAIQTGPLPEGLPEFEIVQPSAIGMSDKAFFVNFRPTNIPFLVDIYGKVRWYATGFSVTSKRGFQRLQNGNLCFGADKEVGKIFEFTMMGEKLNEWDIGPFWEDIHHDVFELPNGNFIVTVNKAGAPTVEDYLIEIERSSGNIITIWDLNEVLPKRTTFFDDEEDWVHVNAVIYDESDNSLIVSGQRQGIFELSWDNQLKWILAPPQGWGEFENYLLQPAPGAEIEYIWGQHAPLLLPDGHLLLFDNGFGRDYGEAAPFSRIVAYQIEEATTGGTVERVWEYGRERGEELFSPIISDVDYLPESNTRLMTAGSLAFDHNYIDSTNIQNTWTTEVEKARLVEVDVNGNVVFEMLIRSDLERGSVYRAEKMRLY